MEKGKLIGRGGTAEVFEWTEDCVIKIFYDYEPDTSIEREINNMKALENCSFKYPKFIEKLQYEGKRAVVYEKVIGVSMMKELENNPFSCRKLAKKLAHLHFMIHENHVDGIREQAPYFKERISWAKALSDDKKEKLYKLVDIMPKGNCLCHSDMHPDNIICNKKGDYIIDWADCCSGNPCADVARTILTLRTAELPQDTSKYMKNFIMFGRNKFCDTYTKEYIKISGRSIRDIDEWKVAVAAYRLCAARENEKNILLKIINDYLEK